MYTHASVNNYVIHQHFIVQKWTLPLRLQAPIWWIWICVFLFSFRFLSTYCLWMHENNSSSNVDRKDDNFKSVWLLASTRLTVQVISCLIFRANKHHKWFWRRWYFARRYCYWYICNGCCTFRCCFASLYWYKNRPQVSLEQPLYSKASCQ